MFKAPETITFSQIKIVSFHTCNTVIIQIVWINSPIPITDSHFKDKVDHVPKNHVALKGPR